MKFTPIVGAMLGFEVVPEEKKVVVDLLFVRTVFKYGKRKYSKKGKK